MVLVGAEDVITPPEHAKALVAAITGCALRRSADCGHLSTLERPEAVTAAISEFLSD